MPMPVTRSPVLLQAWFAALAVLVLALAAPRAAQASLDSLAGNINALNSLSASIASDSSAAHYALDQIQATYNVSGAVDEDHRQLTVLEDEATDTIIRTDRLLKNVSNDVQRQAAYVRNERPDLANLATASFMNGDLDLAARYQYQLLRAWPPVVAHWSLEDLARCRVAELAFDRLIRARADEGEVIASGKSFRIHVSNVIKHHLVWGRLETCGRLAIGLPFRGR